MKKIFFISILFSILSSGCNQNSSDTKGISILPAFKILLTDSTTVLPTDNIQPGKPILMVYFRPDCPHCQAETKSFIQNIEELKKYRIYFLANAPLIEIKNYQHQFLLDQYSNIIVGKDYEQSFFKAFKPKSIPYLAIYDGKKRLVKVYYGEAPISKIISATI